MTGELMFTKEIYNDWMKKTQMQKYSGLRRFLPKIENPIILDVGCGPAWIKKIISEKYKQFCYIGIDIDKKSSADIIADGNNLPFKSAVFDIVLCIDTLHLLSNTKELIRVLNDNGYFIVSQFLSKASLLTKLERNKNLKLISKDIIGEQEKDLIEVFKKIEY